jgi:hypothetical protein
MSGIFSFNSLCRKLGFSEIKIDPKRYVTTTYKYDDYEYDPVISVLENENFINNISDSISIDAYINDFPDTFQNCIDVKKFDPEERYGCVSGARKANASANIIFKAIEKINIDFNQEYCIIDAKYSDYSHRNFNLKFYIVKSDYINNIIKNHFVEFDHHS